MDRVLRPRASERETEQVLTEREAFGAQLQRVREAYGEQIQRQQEAFGAQLQREREAMGMELERRSKAHFRILSGTNRISREARIEARVDRLEAELRARGQRRRRGGPGTRNTGDRTAAQTGAASGEARTEAGARNDLRQPESRPTTLPSLCRQYWGRKRCTKTSCQELHLCKLFLAGICNYGDRCRWDHSLHSPHNKVGTRDSHSACSRCASKLL